MRGAGMRETLQRAVQSGEPPAHRAPLCSGALGLANLDAVQVCQHAYACRAVVLELDRAVRGSIHGAHDARHRLFRRHAGDVIERCDLEVDDVGGLGRVADLENVAGTLRRLNQAVLVTFAGER